MSIDNIGGGNGDAILSKLRNAMDNNRDGKISGRELVNFLDSNRDGRLTANDLNAFEDRFAAAMKGDTQSGSATGNSAPTRNLPATPSLAELAGANKSQGLYAGNNNGANVGDTQGFGYRGIPDGMVAGEMQDGTLHVTRDRRSSESGNPAGVYTALTQSMQNSFIPDARGVIDGKAAPGLEGWKELVDNGEQGKYRGYKGFLEANYPGGHAQWKQDFESLRRNTLLGENNPVTIKNTSGIG